MVASMKLVVASMKGSNWWSGIKNLGNIMIYQFLFLPFLHFNFTVSWSQSIVISQVENKNILLKVLLQKNPEMPVVS